MEKTLPHPPDIRLQNELVDGVGRLCIGDMTYDISSRTLITDQENTILEPRVGEVLLYLANAQGPVSRGKLIESIWGVQGSDEALTQAISRLRRALNDTTRPYKTIITVPRQGYKLGTKPVFAEASGYLPISSNLKGFSKFVQRHKKFLSGFVCGIVTMTMVVVVWVATHPHVQVEETIMCYPGATNPQCISDSLKD